MEVAVKTTFKEELGNEVKSYFKNQKNGRFATKVVWIKAIILLVLFFTFYGVILLGGNSQFVNLGFVIGLGITSLLIIFNIGHDAVHGALSKKKWVNKLMGYTFNLVGGNAYSWKLKHNDAHHIFTNIKGKDHDTDIDPFMRVSPHETYRWYYRWQHIYWPIVYVFFSILVIFIVDFLIFFQVRKSECRFFQPLREWGILLVTKVLYLWYMFWLPINYGGFSFEEVLVAFLIMHAINGLAIGLVFQPSHYFFESIFYAKNYVKVKDWHEHQVVSTLDISPQNMFLCHLLGSLNANVSHHLYPAVSYIHYPALSAIIQRKSHKFRIPYHRKTYWKALKSHVALLKKYSNP